MDVLDAIFAEAIQEAQPQGGTTALEHSLMPEDSPNSPPENYGGVAGATRGGAIAKLRYTHEAMADLIIANPAISQNELGFRFGYSAAWVSRVIASDAFQSYLAERSKELVDPTIKQAVEEQFKGLVLRSLEILQHKLNKSPDLIPDNLALRTLEIASRAAGYGGKPDPTPVSPVSINLHLESLGDNLTKLLVRKQNEVLETASLEALTTG